MVGVGVVDDGVVGDVLEEGAQLTQGHHLAERPVEIVEIEALDDVLDLLRALLQGVHAGLPSPAASASSSSHRGKPWASIRGGCVS